MEVICDGDRNTRFFHLSTIIRRKKNQIECLQDDQGNWIWDHSTVKQMVINDLKNVFAGPVSVCDLTGLTIGLFPQLTCEEKEKLDREYTSAEIQGALNQMSPYKAPGPDGFQAIFYQSQWETISPSLCHMILGVLHEDNFPEGFGDTFLALIPKTDHPNKASGQRVSRAKSKVFFSSNVDEAEILPIITELNIEKIEDLGMYLGMPIINGRVTRDTFDYVVQRVDKRLSGWKAKNLSLAGRTTLIQSTLSPIPAYAIQTAKLPRAICDDLDKKTRRFLWGGDQEKRGLSLVSWDMVTNEKVNGGLCLRSMRQVNVAFMAKLDW
ncbi:uncharacterized protein LOC141617725 [Silene latifolia]|uniref:uncharacterized protein LOC141617725 n=1 Tax=Silene latifolia TaxID=37657 RepID=UPI003D783DDE